MATPRKSQTTLSLLVGLGAFVQVVGGIMLKDGGPLAWAFVAIGSAMMLAGLTGWGVLLALRAHAEETAGRAASAERAAAHAARLKG